MTATTICPPPPSLPLYFSLPFLLSLSLHLLHSVSLSPLSPSLLLFLSLSPSPSRSLCPPLSAGTRPRPTPDAALSHPSPTDLRFSNLGSREVKLHWINPAGPVQQYRVVYHSAEDHKAKEVRSTGHKLHTGGDS